MRTPPLFSSPPDEPPGSRPWSPSLSPLVPGIQKSQGTGPVRQRHVCSVSSLHTLSLGRSPLPPSDPLLHTGLRSWDLLNSGPDHLSPSLFIQTLRLAISTAHSIIPPLEGLGAREKGVPAGLAPGAALKCKQPWTRRRCFPSPKHTCPPHTLTLSAERGSPETAACLVVGWFSSKFVFSGPST